METTGNYYVLQHLVLMTGLTDRTLRNYIAAGILKGEKINGLWHFTPEQVESFMVNPMVRPSILAKNNGLVYDFLLDTGKRQPGACIILDIPEGDRKTIGEFFCYRISQGEFQNIHFSFDRVGKQIRVILKGDASEVLCLVNAYNDGCFS